MRYEVFADRIFGLHFGMNLLLLLLTAKLGGYRTGWKRLAAAAAAGSLFYVAVLLWPMGGLVAVRPVKTLLMTAGTLVTLYAVFGGGFDRAGAKRAASAQAASGVGRSAAAEAGAFYAASACVLGGAVSAANGMRTGSKGVTAGRVLLYAAAAAGAGTLLVKAAKSRQRDPFWSVRLAEGEKSCLVTALMDSGNSLYDPVSKRPVCIAQREVLEQLGLLEKPEKFRLIPYHSIGRPHGLLQAAVAEEICLQKGAQKLKKKNVLLAVSDQPLSGTGRYQLLLHPALLEETKGAKHNDIESSDAGKDAV